MSENDFDSITSFFYNSQLCDLSRQINTTKSSHILLLLTDNHTHSHPTMPAPEQLCSHDTPKTKTHAHTSSTTWTVSNYRSWLVWSVPAIVLCVLIITLTHSHTHTHTHLALLVAIGQKLQAVCGNSQELGVALIQQGNHPLQAIS